MQNIQLWKIVESYREQLKAIWYDINDENFEDYINWFIKIANSMMNEEMEKMPNIDFAKFLQSLSPNYEMSIIQKPKFEEVSNKYFNINIKPKFDLKNKDKIYEEISNYLVLSNEDLFWKFLKWENKKLIIDWKLTKKQIKNMLEKSNILEKFNKWELTEKENQIIIELLKN